MLVAMARAAANSLRKNAIFEPYPSVVDPDDKNRLAFTPEVLHSHSSIAAAQKLILIVFYSPACGRHAVVCLQCFDAVGWAAGRASGL